MVEHMKNSSKKQYQWNKSYPENITLSTSEFWERSIKFININYYDQLELFKFYILKYFMMKPK